MVDLDSKDGIVLVVGDVDGSVEGIINLVVGGNVAFGRLELMVDLDSVERIGVLWLDVLAGLDGFDVGSTAFKAVNKVDDVEVMVGVHDFLNSFMHADDFNVLNY